MFTAVKQDPHQHEVSHHVEAMLAFESAFGTYQHRRQRCGTSAREEPDVFVQAFCRIREKRVAIARSQPESVDNA
jgi:hypothetical protein